ncbi:MAG: sodium:proton antiporter [Lachnospiraceae bacterium]|nr:sodium:proton antiporter [Lachnospiraceae bacterium]
MNGNGILLFLVLGPMIGALLCYLVGRKNKTARNFLADGIAILEFLLIFVLFVQKLTGGADLAFTWEGFCGFGLNLELDGFRALYGSIAALMWMMTTIFSREYFAHYRNRNRYYLFLLLTLGSTMGVFLSADLYTTFIFFEIMSFTSFVWVAHEEKEAAMRAALTYLGVAVIGGLVMLMGIFLLYQITGTLDISELLEASRHALDSAEDPASSTLVMGIFGGSRAAIQAQLYLAGGLMLFGFGAKAGMFPLHIWLPKAHPVAPAPASALLSGILTKSGIFGVLAVTSNIFLHDPNWGMMILLLGTVTMFGGALLAVFSVDFKRTLACSSMSQIGFILVGVGMQCLLGEENALAVRGTLLHMVNHSLIKLDLFMVAGVIFMNIHKLNLNEIRGFGRKKPLLMFSYLMGALGIGGIPLWDGYISKTLLHESIVEYKELIHEAAEGMHEAAEMVLMGNGAFWTAIEWIFLISGGMTIAYMLKLFVAVFLEENEDKALQKKYDSMKSYWNMESKFAVVGSAILLPILGFLPTLTMDKLADLGQEFMYGEAPAHAVHYFSLVNLKGACISIVIGAVLYFGVIRTLLMKKTEEGRCYINAWPEWLDLENLIYRPILLVFLPAVCGFVMRLLDTIPDVLVLLARKTIFRQSTTPIKDKEEDHMAISLGRKIDRLTKRDHEHSVIPGLIRREERTVRTFSIMSGSLSFGLLMATVGLLAILIYLFIAI